jgi:predicted TPR repeat methyltransferase
MAVSLEERLKAAYGAAGDRRTLDRVYDDWAKDYDADLWASGNPYIAILSGIVGRQVEDPNAKILDAGCGSGLMGQVLHQVGYRNIDGLDASEGMLAAARAKGCYDTLYKLLLGAEIDLQGDSYDAIVAAGVMTHGHAPPESLEGLLRLAKPGAPIIFSISKIAVEEGGFGDMMDRLETAGAWHLAERTEPFRTYPFSEEMAELRHWICAYRKAWRR